jgi:osmoprotectant transport system ATP-binding protein
MGYVIQHVGLFPHRTVAQNIATVPDLLGWDRARVRARTAELLDLVGLDPAVYAGRYPQSLSGGQRQRVGVARALAADPPVLLMDEPFGAVDPLARDRLQQEFLRLQQAIGKTVVLVTHDVEEAVRLGDRIAVLSEGGRLEQHATPAEVLGAPASEVVAGFVGGDRGIKRLAVTPIGAADLEPPRAEPPRAEPPRAEPGSSPGQVALGDTLRDALGVLLRLDAAWVDVVDPASGAVVGSLTADAIRAAARRGADAAPAAAARPGPQP